MLAALSLLGVAVLAQIFFVMRPAGQASGDAFSNSGLFPGLVAAVLLLCVALRGLALIKEAGAQDPTELEALGPRIACLAVLAGFTLALPWLGYILTAFALTVAMLWLCGVRRLWPILALSTAAPLAIWGVFQHILNVILPFGRLWGALLG